MILAALIAVLFFGGVLAWITDRWGFGNPRWIALTTLIADLIILLVFYFNVESPVQFGGESWLAVLNLPWIPRFGIHFLLAMDNLSLLMLLLTLFLGIVAVLSSWGEGHQRSGFFHFNLLWTLAGVVGVFTALDLFLFFFFWEVMLIPMSLLIAIWGHENRIYAAIKFFIFTQASGLLLLLAMITLVYFQYQSTGALSFSYFDLRGADLSGYLPDGLAYYLMLGFFIAFVVKLPGVPVHTWLPDAHTQAPTAGSVILAGILLKTGAYGLIRFSVPLFPEASAAFAPIAMWLGVVSIIYTAMMAFAQTDIKRLIAYTSVSHMGFVLLGIYAAASAGSGYGGEQARQGAVMTMLAHGMTSAALFAFAGAVQQRIHTRDMREMGGFWRSAPRMGAIVMFFSVAALGMPGLANFVGEFLVLVGSFQTNQWITVFAAAGLILAPVYSLIVIQRVFHGGQGQQDEHGEHGTVKAADGAGLQIADFSSREVLMMAMMMLVTLALGVYPQPLLEMLSAGNSL